jgi:hypothetical protein
MKLTGKVGDGQGHASGWLKDPLFTELLGQIHPASLNVFVPGAHDYAPNASNYPNPGYIRGQKYLAARACKVNGVEAFILRNEHPGPSYRRGSPIPAPNTMFEIVARTVIPNVDHGAEVTLEFDEGDEHLKKLPVR